MAGQKGRSGRGRLPGRVYRLNIRYRPERHPPELNELLALLNEHDIDKRGDILAAMAAGGGLAAAQAATSVETGETESLLADLFGT
jgi:hypothetical protein